MNTCLPNQTIPPVNSLAATIPAFAQAQTQIPPSTQVSYTNNSQAPIHQVPHLQETLYPDQSEHRPTHRVRPQYHQRHQPYYVPHNNQLVHNQNFNWQPLPHFNFPITQPIQTEYTHHNPNTIIFGPPLELIQSILTPILPPTHLYYPDYYYLKSTEIAEIIRLFITSYIAYLSKIDPVRYRDWRVHV